MGGVPQHLGQPEDPDDRGGDGPGADAGGAGAVRRAPTRAGRGRQGRLAYGPRLSQRRQALAETRARAVPDVPDLAVEGLDVGPVRIEQVGGVVAGRVVAVARLAVRPEARVDARA